MSNTCEDHMLSLDGSSLHGDFIFGGARDGSLGGYVYGNKCSTLSYT